MEKNTLLIVKKLSYNIMKQLFYKFVRFFETKVGWFFVNGRKIEWWEKYVQQKYKN
jgi:hypothetical protein